jgi:LacI family transcriptional regulator
MSEERRVSYADIAMKVGYHRSTVGLALRNHPDIPEGTKAKIRKVAEAMGYRPDPTLSLVGRLQRRGVSERRFNSIALLIDDRMDSDWRRTSHTNRDYLAGLRERAEELGFHLDIFTVGQDREYVERVDQVLRARGIQSVIVCPLLNQELPIDLKWSQYSAVALGYSLPSPGLIRITSQHRTGASDVVRELYNLGYRKLGLVLHQVHDLRVNRGWSAGFLSACMDPELIGIEYDLFMPRNLIKQEAKALINWIETSGVDAVISPQPGVFEYLIKNGVNIPEDLGYACLDLPSEETRVAGIDQKGTEIGRQAVDQVAGLHAHHQRGLPRTPLIITVKGEWVSGPSVKTQENNSH